MPSPSLHREKDRIPYLNSCLKVIAGEIMSVKIDSQTNTDATARTPSEKKVTGTAATSVDSLQPAAEKSDKVTLSTQGIELSKSASTDPDASMTHAEMAKTAYWIVVNIGRRTDEEVGRADKEVPKSDDPERLARAKQATDALYHQAPSPFAGYSRKELTTVIYDDSGAYTANERSVALRDQQTMDSQFWGPLFQKSEASGDYRDVFETALAFYDQLSPLEKAAYPADYKAQISAQLKWANDKAGGEIDDKKRTSLLDMVQALDKKNKQRKDADQTPSANQVSGEMSWSARIAELALEGKGSASTI
jgi:hypothetical protein